MLPYFQFSKCEVSGSHDYENMITCSNQEKILMGEMVPVLMMPDNELVMKDPTNNVCSEFVLTAWLWYALLDHLTWMTKRLLGRPLDKGWCGHHL